MAPWNDGKVIQWLGWYTTETIITYFLSTHTLPTTLTRSPTGPPHKTAPSTYPCHAFYTLEKQEHKMVAWKASTCCGQLTRTPSWPAGWLEASHNEVFFVCLFSKSKHTKWWHGKPVHVVVSSHAHLPSQLDGWRQVTMRLFFGLFFKSKHTK